MRTTMNKYKALVALVLLAGCPQCGPSYGPALSEPAEVDSLAFVPEGHGSGSGLTSNGHTVFTSVYIPARYAVVFHCQHGKFVIEGDDDRHRALWEKFKEHDQVTVRYREKLEHHDDGNRVVGLDFLDAEKR